MLQRTLKSRCRDGITAAVSDPPGTTGSPHRIDLALYGIDAPFFEIYLPLVRR